ncbi:MAG: AAA family ATPase, partial [Candidatus Omnitrophota bacterium]
DFESGLNSNEEMILVELPGGETDYVCRYKWELFNFQINPSTKSPDVTVIGTFKQYPLKLAWAITVHKSQGKTFERVIIDTSGGVFACGQMYVALSRCRTLEGILFTRPLQKKHIFTDQRIEKFFKIFRSKNEQRED